MATVAKPVKAVDAPADAGNTRIRITLSSTNVKNLEKGEFRQSVFLAIFHSTWVNFLLLHHSDIVCADLKSAAQTKSLKISGPVRLPTKKLVIVTRKTPCGEGSKTWDRFEMRIHKRILDLHCASDIVKQFTSITIEPGVDVVVFIIRDEKN